MQPNTVKHNITSIKNNFSLKSSLIQALNNKNKTNNKLVRNIGVSPNSKNLTNLQN